MKEMIGEIINYTPSGSLKLDCYDKFIMADYPTKGKELASLGEKLKGLVVVLSVVDRNGVLCYVKCKEFKKKETPENIEFETPVIKSDETDNEFMELYKIHCEIEKKGGLNYVRWGEAWLEMKKLDINANYEVHENANGMPYFSDKTGAFVKVSVTFRNQTHKVMLPVMDFRNQPVKEDGLTSFIINKSIQRCFTKAIAMFGIGLFVYLGEETPEEKE